MRHSVLYVPHEVRLDTEGRLLIGLCYFSFGRLSDCLYPVSTYGFIKADTRQLSAVEHSEKRHIYVGARRNKTTRGMGRARRYRAALKAAKVLRDPGTLTRARCV